MGDATREVLKNNSSQGQNAWWSYYSYNIYSSYPWVLRGGDYASGITAGMFNVHRLGANSWKGIAFRSVITAP